jgi:hypothetical protein
MVEIKWALARWFQNNEVDRHRVPVGLHYHNRVRSTFYVPPKISRNAPNRVLKFVVVLILIIFDGKELPFWSVGSYLPYMYVKIWI